MDSLISFYVGQCVTFWPGQDKKLRKAPKGMDLTQEMLCLCCHNSVHCIVLVAVGAALGGGHYRSALRERCMCTVSGCGPNGFFNTQP